jgi:hypothetical protein
MLAEMLWTVKAAAATENGTLKTYTDVLHGMPTTRAETITPTCWLS